MSVLVSAVEAPLDVAVVLPSSELRRDGGGSPPTAERRCGEGDCPSDLYHVKIGARRHAELIVRVGDAGTIVVEDVDLTPPVETLHEISVFCPSCGGTFEADDNLRRQATAALAPFLRAQF